MCTDHSCIENSVAENKHISFENDFADQNQIQLELHSPLDRLTAYRSALANLIITYIHLYRAQYSTGCQSCLSNEDQVTSAVGITDQKFIHL